MPGASQVSIINLGLSHVAQAPIVAITDVSPQALAAMRVWDSSLREALRAGKPGFATAVVALALHGTYVPLHWLYAYKYPANCLSMNFVYNEGTEDPEVGEEWKKIYNPDTNENIIVTNCELAYGEYIYLVTDTTLFDPSFVTTLGYRLGMELAVPLVGDKELKSSLEKQFFTAASECARYDKGERKKQAKQTSTFVDARG